MSEDQDRPQVLEEISADELRGFLASIGEEGPDYLPVRDVAELAQIHKATERYYHEALRLYFEIGLDLDLDQDQDQEDDS